MNAMVISTITMFDGSSKLAMAVASHIANLSLDTWVVALLIWAVISVVLTIGFVVIVPIVAPRSTEKQRQRDALIPGRATPPPTDTRYE